MKRVLVIPDLQSPFHHIDSIPFLKAVAKNQRTNAVVCIGDEVDFHALSNFDADPDGYSAGHELVKALEFLEELYKAFPKVKVCVSNHTARPLRKAFSSGIPRVFIKDYHEFLEAPDGWQWANHWEVDGVIYEHGEMYGGEYSHIKHAINNQKPTVIGHHHSNAGIMYTRNREKLLWGMAAGCLLDDEAYAFKYNKKTPRRPILGCGVVINGQPRFKPMILDSKGRWIKKLT